MGEAMLKCIIVSMLAILVPSVEAKNSYDMGNVDECEYTPMQKINRDQVIKIHANRTNRFCSLTFKASDKDDNLEVEFITFSLTTCTVSLYLSETEKHFTFKKSYTCGDIPETFVSETGAVTLTLCNTATEIKNVSLELLVQLKAIQGSAIIPKQTVEESEGLDPNVIALLAGTAVAILVCVALVPLRALCFRNRGRQRMISYIQVGRRHQGISNNSTAKSHVSNRPFNPNPGIYQLLLPQCGTDSDTAPPIFEMKPLQGPPDYGELSCPPPSYDEVTINPRNPSL